MSSRQSDLSEFGFISYSLLPRQTKLTEFTKEDLILDTLREYVKEQETNRRATE